MTLVSLILLVATGLVPDQASRNPSTALMAADPPVYVQAFKTADVRKEYVFSDPKVWRVKADEKGGWLAHVPGQKYKTPQRSPHNIGLIADWTFVDFVLECEMLQTGKEYGHRDMCVFYGFKDRSHFYYTHIASVTDDHAHNCFIVNDKPRIKISHETTKGHKWSAKDWHRVRLVREHASGKIEVYVNDMKKPIMRATDKTFDWGRIGFGSFDDAGRVRNVRLYAPESRKSKASDPFVEGRK